MTRLVQLISGCWKRLFHRLRHNQCDEMARIFLAFNNNQNLLNGKNA